MSLPSEDDGILKALGVILGVWFTGYVLVLLMAA